MITFVQLLLPYDPCAKCHHLRRGDCGGADLSMATCRLFYASE
jgi:hypothetical protein